MSENSRLDWSDIKKNAAKFVLRFKDVRKEASYKQVFWSEFLQMFGVDVIQVGAFEYYVKKLGNHPGEIDYFWPGKVIIEHKSSGKDLDNAMDQAMDYLMGIQKKEELPRYIIVSDFKRIRLMDLADRRDTTISLKDLPDNVEMFGFLAGYSDKRIEGQHPVNVKAAEVMGELYDILKESGYPENDLDLLLIRIVFCMFAEDADIFEKELFSSYLSFHTGDDGSGMGAAINEIFAVLNTPYESRQSAMSAELQRFPYVNGGLFEKTLTTPMFDRNMREHFFKASRLDWKYISPAIFGSLFQSIMDPQKRRELGAHYTSEENILRVINPLFMDDLRAEFNKIKGNPKELRKFWDELSGIRVLDPACGCGNFLIISYREMRRLEMDILDAIYKKGQKIFDESHLFIDHYYGIEIGEFASMVANLSMILMDHLMNMEMRNRFGKCRDIIPLKDKANIICANSLTMDWSELVKPTSLSFIVGNPPFIGAAMMNDIQKKEAVEIFGKIKLSNSIDYVGAWYCKAARFIQNTRIRCAFVSTNSICQGEQVGALWGMLLQKYGVKIDFAYRTFKWSNEARGKAAVHCIIVAFSLREVPTKKFIVTEKETKHDVAEINPYLIEGPPIIVESRSTPLCDVPRMTKGNQASDGKNLVFAEAEKEAMITKNPGVERYIRTFIGAKEYINGGVKYCIWIRDEDRDWVQYPEIVKRVENVRSFRMSSSAKPTRDKAEVPYKFFSVVQPREEFIVIPRVSSESREYIPMGLFDPEIIASDELSIVHGKDLYYFGILTSKIHMDWMRTVAGRLKSDYRYSGSVVYNTFPWPDASDEEKDHIRQLSRNILDIRSKYSDEELATLYNINTMPLDLRKAHAELDQAVCRIYGFDPDDEYEWVGLLLKRYDQMTHKIEGNL